MHYVQQLAADQVQAGHRAEKASSAPSYCWLGRRYVHCPGMLPAHTSPLLQALEAGWEMSMLMQLAGPLHRL